MIKAALAVMIFLLLQITAENDRWYRRGTLGVLTHNAANKLFVTDRSIIQPSSNVSLEGGRASSRFNMLLLGRQLTGSVANSQFRPRAVIQSFSLVRHSIVGLSFVNEMSQ